jgi:hypothetical protein
MPLQKEKKAKKRSNSASDSRLTNPEGLSYLQFLDKWNNIRNLAKICWYFGVLPDQLKKELEILLAMGGDADEQESDDPPAEAMRSEYSFEPGDTYSSHDS